MEDLSTLQKRYDRIVTNLPGFIESSVSCFFMLSDGETVDLDVFSKSCDLFFTRENLVQLIEEEVETSHGNVQFDVFNSLILATGFSLE